MIEASREQFLLDDNEILPQENNKENAEDEELRFTILHASLVPGI